MRVRKLHFGSGEEGGEWVTKGTGLSSANWPLHSSHGDVKDSTGNTANGVVITRYAARQALGIPEGSVY